VCTGKPLGLHGSYGRDTAAGRGAGFAAALSLKRFLGRDVRGTSFVVQGGACAMMHGLAKS